MERTRTLLGYYIYYIHNNEDVNTVPVSIKKDNNLDLKIWKTEEKAQNWKISYSALQRANKQLANRTKTLEKQMQELRQAEQQIWTVLAASTKARHQSANQGETSSADDQVVGIIKKVLSRLRKKALG